MVLSSKSRFRFYHSFKLVDGVCQLLRRPLKPRLSKPNENSSGFMYSRDGPINVQAQLCPSANFFHVFQGRAKGAMKFSPPVRVNLISFVSIFVHGILFASLIFLFVGDLGISNIFNQRLFRYAKTLPSRSIINAVPDSPILWTQTQKYR